MTIKFSGLVDIVDGIVDGDLFALSDVSASQTKSITFASLKTSILDSTTFDANGPNIPLIITGINGYSSGTGNALSASKLYHNGSYRDSSYFLTWGNIAGTPTIPADVKDLTNTSGYLRFQGADQTGTGVIWSGAGAGNTGNPSVISTTNISEGTNQYYTTARGAAAVVANFGEQFNIYNSTFDKGDVRDSLDAQPATFGEILVTGTGNQSKTLKFSSGNYSKLANYSVGQVLRIYGASLPLVSDAMVSTFSVVTTGFATTNSASKSGTGGVIAYNYKIAEFDLVTGEVSAASSSTNTTIGVPTTSGASTVAEAFNTAVFNKIVFGSVPATKGLLIYRQIGTSTFDLVQVAGKKETEAGAWIDYQAFDYTTWSGKDAVTNAYTTVTHFPLTAQATARKGWVDRTISQVIDSSSTFDVILDDFVFVNTDNLAQVSHNDTQLIQTAITNNKAAGKKSITLNAKTYNSGKLVMPNDFGLTGTSYITKLKKLAWSGGDTDEQTLIKSNTDTGASSLSIVGIDIEGNASNQFLTNDSTTLYKNYILNFGTACNSLLLDRVRVNNSVGGGIWATSPVEMKLNTSEVINSGTTDRYSFSPLVADFGQDTMIVGNRFQNYTNYLDVSVTNKGIVANNVINNCGSGLFIYGSVFFISSPNVLMGPAQEFLPTPDILNSEYDLVNIDLSSASASNSFFNSAIHVYQEDGALFDISVTAGTINTVEYRAFYLSKTGTGVEEVYGTTQTAGSFVIGKRYTILTTSGTTQAQWNTAAGTSSRTYSIGDDFVAAAVGAGSGTATSGSVDSILLNDRPADADRSLGQFAFQIPSSTVQAIRTSGGAHSYSTLSTSDALINNTTTKHVGIGWSASRRTEVSAGTLSSTAGAWTVDNAANTQTTSSNGTNPTYAVEVTGLKYLAVGQKVKFKDHAGFNNSGNIIMGIVRSITTVAGTSTVVLQFMGAGGGQVQNTTDLTAGQNGTINIIDTFVMAQGRII